MRVYLHGLLKVHEKRGVIARCSPRFDVFAIRRICSPWTPFGDAPEAFGFGSCDLFFFRGPIWVPPNNFVFPCVFPFPEILIRIRAQLELVLPSHPSSLG